MERNKTNGRAILQEKKRRGDGVDHEMQKTAGNRPAAMRQRRTVRSAAQAWRDAGGACGGVRASPLGADAFYVVEQVKFAASFTFPLPL
jgi:hypothetical protein